MSPCAPGSGSIVATSSIVVLHLGQPMASFRIVSDTTQPQRITPTLKRANDRTFPLYRQKVLTRFFAAMPIRPYLDGHRFDAETTRLMGIAFETAVAALPTQGDVEPPRDIIARMIIDLAKTGERDPERLCEAALKAVSVYPIVNAPNPLPPHASPPVLPDS
jgi:hypothetical protein